MTCISGSSDTGNSVQQNKSKIKSGSYYACHHDNDWNFGLVNYVSFENLDVSIKFLHPEEPVTQFFWPNCNKIC